MKRTNLVIVLMSLFLLDACNPVTDLPPITVDNVGDGLDSPTPLNLTKAPPVNQPAPSATAVSHCRNSFSDFYAALVVYRDLQAPILRIARTEGDQEIETEDFESTEWIVDNSVAWSTDGNRIAYSVETKNGDPGIAILELASHDRKLLTINRQDINSTPLAYTFRVPPLGFSPNDEWIRTMIRYLSNTTGHEIISDVIINFDNSRLIFLDPEEGFASWGTSDKDTVFYTVRAMRDLNKSVIYRYHIDGNGNPVREVAREIPLIDSYQLSLSYRDSLIAFMDREALQIHIEHIFSDDQILTYSAEYSNLWMGPWSTGDQWVAAYKIPLNYLVFFNSSENTSIAYPLNLMPYSMPIGWAPDFDEFYYQEGVNLYSVSPTREQICYRGTLFKEETENMGGIPPSASLYFPSGDSP